MIVILAYCLQGKFELGSYLRSSEICVPLCREDSQNS